MSLWDVLQQAADPSGRPLLRLQLRQILLAQPGVGVKTARSYLNDLADLLGLRLAAPSHRSLTVQWLLDPKAHGRRMLALLDVMSAPTDPHPWSGFPFAAPPTPAAPTVAQGA